VDDVLDDVVGECDDRWVGEGWDVWRIKILG